MQKEIKVTPLYYNYVLDNDYDVVLQIGGRFSGKTQNDQIRLIKNVGTKPDYKLLVIENVETGMADGFHAGLRRRIEEFEHEQAYNPKSRTAYIKNVINNNEVLFRGYASEQQRMNVKKLDGITEIVVEEGEWMDKSAFMGLIQQLRGGREEDRKLTILLNPVNPDCFANQEFIMKTPDNIYEYFPNTQRPKVFDRQILTTYELDGQQVESQINVLVVISTHLDNPFLNPIQRASVESLTGDEYEQLAEAKFIQPKGALLKQKNYFSVSKLNLDQAARITAIIDTASSGKDSATLGIYAEYDPEHHYLIDALKDSDDAKKVIPRMITMLKKWNPQNVMIERNHEGLYYKDKISSGTPANIMVTDFWSSENKHEKILGQAGRIQDHLYVRDDAGAEYNEYVSEAYSYNKDKKKNKFDDCIDNMAMYFKHGNKPKWGW